MKMGLMRYQYVAYLLFFICPIYFLIVLHAHQDDLINKNHSDFVAVTSDGRVSSDAQGKGVIVNNQAQKQLVIGNVNPHVVDAQYAVRGEILLKALDIEKRIRNGDTDGIPFNKLVKCNIGNPQALGQKPITFTRQVLSLVLNPELASLKNVYPTDVIERAKKYLSAIPSVGAYSDSQGVDVVRKEVVAFIERRDGKDIGNVNHEDIFLTEGASQAVEMILTLILRDQNDMLLVPVPQYPLYSALTTLLNGHFEGFEMTEENGWGIDLKVVKGIISNARKQGKNPRALVIINPGNPTGSTLDLQTMLDIIDFCAQENLILLADEVYQENIYRRDTTKFISFRKAFAIRLSKLNEEHKKQFKNFQMVSFHSTSKGVVGECGLRGGYMQLQGFDEDVKSQLYKMASVRLCSNVPGQIAVGLMVNPPVEGDESYPLYKKETEEVFSSLKRRAEKLEKALNSLKGIKCNPLDGAMYAFPSIELPKSFIELAKKQSKMPDTLYALKLLEATGIVVVPGSGFGQRNGTWHIRTTFLPPESEMDYVIKKFSEFHNKFMEEYK